LSQCFQKDEFDDEEGFNMDFDSDEPATFDSPR